LQLRESLAVAEEVAEEARVHVVGQEHEQRRGVLEHAWELPQQLPQRVKELQEHWRPLVRERRGLAAVAASI
jgi:hypothetical protein